MTASPFPGIAGATRAGGKRLGPHSDSPPPPALRGSVIYLEHIEGGEQMELQGSVNI